MTFKFNFLEELILKSCQNCLSGGLTPYFQSRIGEHAVGNHLFQVWGL